MFMAYILYGFSKEKEAHIADKVELHTNNKYDYGKDVCMFNQAPLSRRCRKECQYLQLH